MTVVVETLVTRLIAEDVNMTRKFNEAKESIFGYNDAIAKANREQNKLVSAQKLGASLTQKFGTTTDKVKLAQVDLNAKIIVYNSLLRKGIISQETYRRALDDSWKAIKRVGEATAGTNQQLARTNKQLKKVGGGFKNLNQPMTQAAFAMDDLITVFSFGGLTMRSFGRGVQSAGNNLTQIIALTGAGGLKSTLAIIGTSLVATLIPALLLLGDSGKKAEEKLKELKDEFNDFKAGVDAATRAVQDLIDKQKELTALEGIRETKNIEEKGNQTTERRLNNVKKLTEQLRAQTDEVTKQSAEIQKLEANERAREERILPGGPNPEERFGPILDFLTKSVGAINEWTFGIASGTAAIAAANGELAKTTLEQTEIASNLRREQEAIVDLERKITEEKEKQIKIQNIVLADFIDFEARGSGRGFDNREMANAINAAKAAGIDLKVTDENRAIVLARINLAIQEMRGNTFEVVKAQRILNEELEIQKKIVQDIKKVNKQAIADAKKVIAEQEKENKLAFKRQKSIQKIGTDLQNRIDRFNFTKGEKKIAQLVDKLKELKARPDQIRERVGLQQILNDLEMAKEKTKQLKDETKALVEAMKGVEGAAAGSAEAVSRVNQFRASLTSGGRANNIPVTKTIPNKTETKIEENTKGIHDSLILLLEHELGQNTIEVSDADLIGN